MADLTAEIFLAALHSRHTYRLGRGSEAGWLYGVARNVLLAQRRRSEREARAVERIVARRLLDGDDIADLTDRIDAEEPARRALSAMADLPEGERRCWNSWSSTREPRPARRPARRLVAVAGWPRWWRSPCRRRRRRRRSPPRTPRMPLRQLDGPGFWIDPKDFGPDETLVVVMHSANGDPAKSNAGGVGVIRGPVAPCELVPAEFGGTS
ncbi:RNA polymerase sigma factor [Nonomuraea bangladeshensis]|uniref:RNA polymerase sigma factor n=1 Tax=Nonomuraea bangladeshensis TaxID=404385 RepID=UPI0031D0D7AF